VADERTCALRCPGNASPQTSETCTPGFLLHLPAKADERLPGQGRHLEVPHPDLVLDPVVQQFNKGAVLKHSYRLVHNVLLFYMIPVHLMPMLQLAYGSIISTS